MAAWHCNDIVRRNYISVTHGEMIRYTKNDTDINGKQTSTAHVALWVQEWIIQLNLGEVLEKKFVCKRVGQRN